MNTPLRLGNGNRHRYTLHRQSIQSIEHAFRRKSFPGPLLSDSKQGTLLEFIEIIARIVEIIVCIFTSFSSRLPRKQSLKSPLPICTVSEIVVVTANLGRLPLAGIVPFLKVGELDVWKYVRRLGSQKGHSSKWGAYGCFPRRCLAIPTCLLLRLRCVFGNLFLNAVGCLNSNVAFSGFDNHVVHP